MSRCEVDGQSNHWFACHLGTVGCPRIHDGLTPHCIACADESVECILHATPAVEMTEAQYEESKRNYQADT